MTCCCLKELAGTALLARSRFTSPVLDIRTLSEKDLSSRSSPLPGFLKFAPVQPASGAMLSARARARKSCDAAIAEPVAESDLYPRRPGTGGGV